MRINKYLSQAGLGSRRKVEQLIINNEIYVNDKIVNNLSYNVLYDDIVKYNNKVLLINSDKKYFILNKPINVITSLNDQFGRKTVIDLLNMEKQFVYPVGRLDYKTTGLLILTNDGDLTNSIIHPSKNIEKEYIVSFSGDYNDNTYNTLSKSMMIDGYKTTPAIIKDVVYSKGKGTLHIIIFEGRNRQIRKMFEGVGLNVDALHRIRIGGLVLPKNLGFGKYKEVEFNFINKIFDKER